MKRLIAHRGNINGPKERLENHPDYIEDAIIAGYDVEIDVWYTDWSVLNDTKQKYSCNKWFLGHDLPTFPVNFAWLSKLDYLDVAWFHAKTIQTLYKLQRRAFHAFFHNKDAVTLTSEGYLWTYPGRDLTKYSICVMPESMPEFYSEEDLRRCYGICSDYVENYRCFA